mmetsp:Transcript_26921/g.31109  ORF Transcript_26921/g.31109 Transcript_26921/m.31109 type:complete len:128 (-) Transcript_26921:181-564(-)
MLYLRTYPNITTVGVIRTDPTNNCNDGFCQNGPTLAGGYIWTLTLTTTIDNISPFSPMSEIFDLEGPVSNMTVQNLLSGCVDLICPEVKIVDGHEQNHISANDKISCNQTVFFDFWWSSSRSWKNRW